MAKRTNKLHISRKQKKQNAYKAAERALAQVAAREGVPLEVVRTQIQLSLMAGLANNDRVVQQSWRKIRPSGDMVTPEDVIAHYVSEFVKY